MYGNYLMEFKNFISGNNEIEGLTNNIKLIEITEFFGEKKNYENFLQLY